METTRYALVLVSGFAVLGEVIPPDVTRLLGLQVDGLEAAERVLHDPDHSMRDHMTQAVADMAAPMEKPLASLTPLSRPVTLRRPFLLTMVMGQDGRGNVFPVQTLMPLPIPEMLTQPGAIAYLAEDSETVRRYTAAQAGLLGAH